MSQAASGSPPTAGVPPHRGLFLRLMPYLGVALILAAALYWPMLADTDAMRVWTGIFISATMASAWNIMAGFCGYPSFGNVAFLGLGAYTTAILMNHGMSFLPTVALGAALTGAFALVVGWPILRVRTHYFAIATLGMAEIVRNIITNMSGLSGGGEGISLPIPQGDPETVGMAFYYGSLGLLVLVLTVAAVMLRRRPGYAWRAIAASEDGAQATGVHTTRYKLLAWVLSAAFTGATGSVYAYWMTFIEPRGMFATATSLKMIVSTLFGGVGLLVGPVLGTVVLEFIAHVAWSNFLYLHSLIFAAMVILIVTLVPGGLWPLAGRLWQALLRRLSAAQAPAPVRAVPRPTLPGRVPVRREGTPLLQLENLGKRFGGLQAVRNVSFAVYPGEIVGLVGPNGSGKTTVLNMISGLTPPSNGTVRLSGRDLRGVPAHAVARAGVGRTFQIVRDFPGMTVRDSVRVGALFGTGPGGVEERVEAAIALLGMESRADALVGSLPGADRRRAELAKAVAMGPQILLLDEVMVGLHPSEAEELIGVIRHLNHAGITILMVEHVMRAVMSLCDRVVVLNRGELLASGPPDVVTRDEQVIAAYLGAKFKGARVANADSQ